MTFIEASPAPYEDQTSYTLDPDGFLLGQRTPTRTYFLHDGLGSIVATSNEAGAESQVARYEPFGACLANCPSGPYRWLGGLGVYLDSQTGLYKMGTRYYDPALGRFTQVDPVPGGALNAYDYAGQDPVNKNDLDGTCIGPAAALCVRVAAAAATALAVRATGAYLAKRLVGTVTSRGQVNTGVSREAAKRTLQRGVRVSEMKSALHNPARVILQKEAIRYEGRHAVVVVSTRNPGNITTVWRKRAWWKFAE